MVHTSPFFYLFFVSLREPSKIHTVGCLLEPLIGYFEI